MASRKKYLVKFLGMILICFGVLNLYSQSAKAIPCFSISKHESQPVFILKDKPIAPGTGILKEFYLENDYEYDNVFQKMYLSELKIYKLDTNNEILYLKKNSIEYKDFIKYLRVYIAQDGKVLFDNNLETLMKDNGRLNDKKITLPAGSKVKITTKISMDKEAENPVQNVIFNFDLNLIYTSNNQLGNKQKISKVTMSMLPKTGGKGFAHLYVLGVLLIISGIVLIKKK